MTGRVLVVGSVNVDLVASVPTHPRPGETVLGLGLRRLPGGKGANQAVAAAAAGAQVRLVGCVGDDDDGASYLTGLAARGVDVTGVRRVAGRRTGTALVTVAPDGENTIVVVPGANDAVSVGDLGTARLDSADVVLLQLEVPLDVVEQTVRRAAAAGTRTVLNASPHADLPPGVLDLCDPVVANELEAAALSSPPRSLVVTLGSRGARWSRDGDVVQVAAPTVDAVDTTGGGDAFAGTLAAAIAAGAGPRVALERAVAAGSAAVTRHGAQDWALDG